MPLAADQAPMSPGGLTHEELRRRARLGVVLLVVRTVVQQLVTLGGMVLLARALDPRDFGIFVIAQFAMSFFAFFGDAGLGAALIQKKEEPSERELSSVFFFQGGAALLIMMVVGVGAGFAHLVWRDLPTGADWVFRALSLGLLLTVLRVIPTILMERKLQFGRLAVIEVVSSLSYYLAAVPLAFLGWNVWSLAVGALVQGFAGLIATHIARPWRPRSMIDLDCLRPILRFGLPFQVKNIVGFVNGAAAPVYAGRVLGAGPVGFINWAQNTAYFPLKLVEIMGRVTFPLYSRMQHDPRALGETLGRSLQACAIGALFFASLFLGLAPQLIEVVFTDKWMPALPLFYVYTVVICFGFMAPVVASALDAIGRPQIFARLSILWTALNWVVVLITTPRWGMIGFAIGYGVHVVVGNIVVVAVMMRLIPGVRLARRFFGPVLSGGVSGALVYAMSGWVTGWFSLGVAAAACLAAFAGVHVLVDLKGLRETLALVPRNSDSSSGRDGANASAVLDSAEAK